MRPSSRSWAVRVIAAVSLLTVFAAFGDAAPHAAAQQATAATPNKTVNVELILDSSGSMATPIQGSTETRMQGAKRVLDDVINAIPLSPGINVGFRVYGHKGDNTEAGKAVSCKSSDLLVPINGVNKDLLRKQVQTFQPTGWTPLAYSLELAGKDFKPGGPNITNAVILVTDGLETCGGDPCAVAGSLHKSNVQLATYVIGFATTEADQRTLQCIATQGGGKLYGASNAVELSKALFTVLQQLQVVVQKGTLEIESIGGLYPHAKITGKTGATDTNPQGTTTTVTLTDSNQVDLNVGVYDVSWQNPSGQQTSIRVNIEANRVTWVRGSIIEFPQGAGETYTVKDQSGVVIWQAPFELGDKVWVLPGIYSIDLTQRVGNPVLISAEVQTLPGTVTKLEVLTAP